MTSLRHQRPTEGMRPRLWQALCLTPVLVATLAGCGRQTKLYPTAADATATGDSNVTTDGRSVLPQGFYNQSVNRALVDVALDGVTASSVALRLQTIAGTNEQGGFNGKGIGNRALLGIAGHNGKTLSSVGNVTFDTKNGTGNSPFALLLLVDLNCDNSTPRVLVASTDKLGTAQTLASGYQRFVADVTLNQWRIAGSELKDPSDNNVVLVPSSSGETTSSLSQLIAKYPSACIRDGSSLESSLPRALPTVGVLFALGTDSTTTASSIFMNRITIGSEIYEGLE